MLFLLTFFAFIFSSVTCAEAYRQGESVDFTVQAGTLIGTGLIEFNSRPVYQTTGDIEVTSTTTPGHEEIPCDSTACLPSNSVTTGGAPSFSTPETVPSSQTFPLIPTFGLLPTNNSFRATPTPTPTGPIVSEATSFRRMGYAWLMTLIVVGFHSFIF